MLNSAWAFTPLIPKEEVPATVCGAVTADEAVVRGTCAVRPPLPFFQSLRAEVTYGLVFRRFTMGAAACRVPHDFHHFRSKHAFKERQSEPAPHSS